MDIHTIKKAPLFATLEDHDVQALLGSMEALRLGRGDVLFREAQEGDQLFIITEGKVKLGRTSVDGRENLMEILGPGDMFGELSLFDPGPRTQTATAVADTHLVAMDNEALHAFLHGRPGVALEMLSQLARRLRKTNDSVAGLVFTDVPGRVAKALLDLSTRFGTPTDEGTLVTHDLTQEELAQLVGASRETVNKALADFASRGWLRLEARAVTIIDADRLQKRSR